MGVRNCVAEIKRGKASSADTAGLIRSKLMSMALHTENRGLLLLICMQAVRLTVIIKRSMSMAVK